MTFLLFHHGGCNGLYHAGLAPSLDVLARILPTCLYSAVLSDDGKSVSADDAQKKCGTGIYIC